MFTIILLCLTTFRIIVALDDYSHTGEKCISILQKHKGELKCSNTTVIYIDQVWLDKLQICYRSSTSLSINGYLKIACRYSSHCIVTNNRNYIDEIVMTIRFHCEQCLSVFPGYPAIITCPESSVIDTYAIQYDTMSNRCPALISFSRNQINRITVCKNLSTCSIQTDRHNLGRANIYYQCKGGSSLPGEVFSTDVQGVSMYAFIIGGIVGVLIITCIIVGVIRLRRCNVQRNTKKNIQEIFNPTNDTTEEQPGPVNNQEAYLTNAPDTSHISTSHAVNLIIAADVSNTYSHLRNTVDDSDVMYDHTVRHNVHNTCEGDYGIAHMKITENDYDVSGNYRQSLSKEADPFNN